MIARRRLLIDAGNSRLKWALVEEGKWCAQGSCDYGDLAAVQTQLRAGTDCFIASVASPVNENQLIALLRAADVGSSWLTAQPDFAGVKNSYLDPLQLGVDR